MINFFRRIRKKMADDNRPLKPAWPAGRYMRYAIGEIVLVVIGILIALQINNWNEERKHKQQELKILRELKVDLLLNIEDFNANIFGYTLSKNANKSIQNAIDQNTSFNDSLIERFGRLYPLVTMLVNRGTYETLKEKGIDIISNDSLRKNLVTYFSKDIPFLEKVETDNIKNLSDNHLTSLLLKDFKTIAPFNLRPNDFDALKTDSYFREILSSLHYYCNWAISRNNDLIVKTEFLIMLIDKELEK